MGRAEREVLRQAADPGTVLLRLLNNLVAALKGAERVEDGKLARKLRASLK
jgi:hypothetical protein